MNENKGALSPVTCTDLLTLPAFQNCKLLTNGIFLYRSISWVHYITLQMDLAFLQGGNFLILKDLCPGDEEAIFQLVQHLRGKRCSGILLAFCADLPEGEIFQQAVAQAVNLRIPLLATTAPIEVSDICKTVGALICRRNFEGDLETKVIRRLLTEDPLEAEGLLNTLKTIGYDDRAVCTSMVFRIDAEDVTNQDLRNSMLAFRDSFRNSGWSFCCGSIFEQKIIFILSELGKDGTHVRDQAERVIHEYQALGKGAKLHCGIGPRWTKLEDARYSIQVALKLARLRHRHCVRDIERQIIFRILCQFENDQELFNIYQRVFEPLIQYDQAHNTNLLQCLKVYLESNLNLQQSANVLYLHVNTMRNRISNIEKLLGCELRSDRWNSFRYYLGFFLEDYLYANSSLLNGSTPIEISDFSTKNKIQISN